MNNYAMSGARVHGFFPDLVTFLSQSGFSLNWFGAANLKYFFKFKLGDASHSFIVYVIF